MSKNRVSKAMPILSIVFFGVSLILLVAKTVLYISQSFVAGGTILKIVSMQTANTVIFAIPAVLFIVYAGLILHRSQKAKKVLMAALILQILSAAAFAGRVAYYNDDWSRIGKEIAFIALFALIALFCLLALIFLAKGKNYKLMMIIAAACGFLVAALLFTWNGLYMLSNASFYYEHVFLLVLRLSAYTVYTLAIIFYYTALIFSACIKEREKRVAVKMKVKE